MATFYQKCAPPINVHVILNLRTQYSPPPPNSCCYQLVKAIMKDDVVDFLLSFLIYILWRKIPFSFFLINYVETVQNFAFSYNFSKSKVSASCTSANVDFGL